MRTFIATDVDFKREFDRKLAKGYKKLVIDADVNTGSNIKLITEGTTLRMVVDTTDAQSEIGEGEQDCITILCKEFGMLGYDNTTKFVNEVSVIPLDGTYFLLNLYKGAITIEVGDQVIFPNIGVDDANLRPVMSDVIWQDYTFFESYIKYLDDEALERYYYDFERFFTISGSKKNGTLFKDNKDKQKDMSLGQYAAYVQQLQTKADAKEAQKAMKQLYTAQQQAIEFESEPETQDASQIDWEDDEDDDEEIDAE